MIYLDNAATTLYKPECVRKAVYEAMGSLGNSGRGLHEPTLEASRIVYETRKRAAEFSDFRMLREWHLQPMPQKL